MIEALALALAALAAPEIEARVKAEGSPLVDRLPDGQARVTFVWRGAGTKSVKLDWPSAKPQGSSALERIAGSDLWVKSLTLPARTRMAYRFVVDLPAGAAGDRIALRAATRPDPLNPRHWLDGTADAASILELPDAAPEPYVARRPGVPAGKLTTARLSSNALGNARDIGLYLPANGAAPEWLLIVFDGDSYTRKVEVPRLLDNLIAAKAVPPMAAVLVSNTDGLARRRDLACFPAFSDFLADELLPWLAGRMTVPPPARRILAGGSLGGLAGACAVLDRPDSFGAVLAQSPSFWWWADGTTRPADPAGPNWVAHQIARRAPMPIRFYLSAGVLEGDGPTGIRGSTEAVRDALGAQGYRVTYTPLPGGHDWYSWRADLPDGLIALTR